MLCICVMPAWPLTLPKGVYPVDWCKKVSLTSGSLSTDIQLVHNISTLSQASLSNQIKMGAYDGVCHYKKGMLIEMTQHLEAFYMVNFLHKNVGDMLIILL